MTWEPTVGKTVRTFLGQLSRVDTDLLLRESLSIFSRCLDPTERSDDGAKFTGLVVGYVQSGKTLSFTTLTALARDNGYKLVVMLTGTSLNLFAQSVSRVKHDLSIGSGPRHWYTLTTTESEHFRHPQQLSESLRSYWSRWLDPLIMPADRRPVLLFCLKNATHLDRLLDVLRLNDLGDCPALVIDDEADQAGLNTRVREGEESGIYRRIQELRSMLATHTYLQYTATPQAPLLLNVIDVLSPSFAAVITPGESYTGGVQYFGSFEELSLVREIPEADIPTSRNQLIGPPDSLLDALAIFFIGVAQGYLDESESSGKNRSMMVHPSERTTQHQDFSNWVQAICGRWRRLLELPESTSELKELESLFHAAYKDLLTTCPLDSLADLRRLWGFLPRAIRETRVIEVNAREAKTPSVNWSETFSHILVGGRALERGYTVEGLTVTYMPRGRGVGNADTIQQRARWFGYKAGYLGLCRVFLSASTMMAYRSYIEHEERMRADLRDFWATGKSFVEWKRRFFLDPGLRPTRQNVHDLDYMRGNFAGEWFAAKFPHVLADVVERNRHLVSAFLNRLTLAQDGGHSERSEHQRHSIARISLRDALEMLLAEFSHADVEDSQKYSGLLLQIEAFLEHEPEAIACVYHMSNGVIRQRRVGSANEIPNIFQGAHPVEARVRGSVYPGDRELFDSEGATIQIHRLRVLTTSGEVLADDVYTLAVRLGQEFSRNWLIQEED